MCACAGKCCGEFHQATGTAADEFGEVVYILPIDMALPFAAVPSDQGRRQSAISDRVEARRRGSRFQKRSLESDVTVRTESTFTPPKCESHSDVATTGPTVPEGYNDELVPVARVQLTGPDGKDVASKYYCGRQLGERLIPGSDGQCGPTSGPQCASCRRFQRWWDVCGEAGQGHLDTPDLHSETDACSRSGAGKQTASAAPSAPPSALPSALASAPVPGTRATGAPQLRPAHAFEFGGLALTFLLEDGSRRTVVFGDEGLPLGIAFSKGPPCKVTRVAHGGRAEALDVQLGWVLEEVSGDSVRDMQVEFVYAAITSALENVGRNEEGVEDVLLRSDCSARQMDAPLMAGPPPVRVGVEVLRPSGPC